MRSLSRNKTTPMPHRMVNEVRDSVPAKASNADESTEMVYLKLKNRDLAKKLADMQKTNGDLSREREILQEELFNEKHRANAYANRIQNCAMECRTAIGQLVGLSETLKNIMEKLAVNNMFVDNNRLTATPPTQKQKTKAVQPMVSGCTISKPTIKIKRISEQLLQATINGESSRTETNDVQNNNSPEQEENTLQPVVNIRRLPERLNFDEIQQQMEAEDAEEDALPTDSDRLQENPSLHGLSTITEQTETGNSRTLLQTSPLIETSATTPRFTSTPMRVPEEADASTSAATSLGSRRSLFVTKRSNKRSASQNSPQPRRSSRKFTPGSPRVVLQRLSEGADENVQVKREKVTPVKRARRNATSKVVSYRELPLTRKMRREF